MTHADRPTLRQVWIDLLLYPTHTLPTAAAPVAIGIGLAIHDGVFMALPALLAFLSSWLVHIGGIFVDNYQLVFRHPDIPEHPELLRGLADGTLTLRRLRMAIAGSYLAAALAGCWLVTVAGFPAVVLGAVGVAASLAYAAGPCQMVKLGVAEPVFFIMFGIVAVVGTYYVQAVAAHGLAPGWLPAPEALPARAFILGLPVGALVTSVLVIDDIRDRAFDAAKGWRTSAVRFGPRWSRAEFVGLALFAYIIPFWFWLGLGFSAWILLPLSTAPLAALIAREVCTRDRRDDLVPMTPRTALLSLAYSVLLAVGIAAS
jgi:1,4-dihydroxy-2-naphthoate octaprenyltransferase